MSGWNFDISQAHRGSMKKSSYVNKTGKRVFQETFQPTKVILATKCGKAIASYYMPAEQRWLGLHDGEQPDAWMPWPTHPYSQSLLPQEDLTANPSDDATLAGDPIQDQKS